MGSSGRIVTDVGLYPALTAWRAAYGARRSSTVNIVSVGSSSIYGSGATAITDRFIDKISNLLAARDGVTVGHHSLATEGTSGGWTSSGTITTSSTGLGLSTKNLAAAATLSRTDTCTGWDIHYVAGSGAGEFTVTIDSGDPTTVTPDTTGTAGRHDGVYSTAVLSSASHTLLITATGAVSISGVYIRNGDTSTGVRSYCSGKGGTTSATWAGADQSLWHRVATLTPALVIVLVGPNDYSTSVTPEMFETNLRDMLADLRATVSPMPSVLLVGTLKRLDTGFTPSYSWTDYTEIMQQVAADNPTWCAYLDISPDFPTTKAENQASRLVSTADYVHQTTSGHLLTADRVVSALLAAAPSAALVELETFGAHQVSGLLADYDPDTLTATIADGGSVASLTPTWGLERAPLVQATSSKQPTLIHDELNSLSVLRFDSGNSQVLDTGLWTKTRGTVTVGKTVLMVVKPTGTMASGKTIYTGSNSDTGSAYCKAQYTSSTVLSIACGGDSDTAIQYTTAADSWYVWMSIYGPTSSTSYIYRLPGLTADRTGTTGTGATAGLAGIRVGGNQAGSGGYISMDLARLCVWDRSLTSDEIGQVLTWIGGVYGISI